MQLIDAAPLMHFPLPLRLRWQRRVLHFRKPAATSRGALTERVTYIIQAVTPLGTGHGECCIMPGLLPEPTAEELEQMKEHVRTAMEAGALGISFGMIYTPGTFADTEEMIELCKVVAEYGGTMTIHMA